MPPVQDKVVAALNTGYDLKRFKNHIFHGRCRIFRKGFGLTVGYDSIHGKTMMSHELTQAVNGRSLHFKIGDPVLAAVEGRKRVDQGREGQGQAELTALRRIKSGTGDRNAMHIVAGKMVEQPYGAFCNIRLYRVTGKVSMLAEGIEDIQLVGIVLKAVVMQQVIEADTEGRSHEAVDRYIFLEGARRCPGV